MLPDMTTATALPPRADFFGRLRLHRSQLALGLGLGLVAELLLDGAPWGLGHGLFAVLAAAAVVRHGGREAWTVAGAHRWLLAGAVALLASTALHASAWLAVMSATAACVLAALALQGWTGERRLGALGPGALLAAPFLTVGQSVAAGATIASQELDRAEVAGAARRWAPPALRLAAIVGPPVLVVTLLLASGDAVFRERVTGVLSALFGFEVAGFVRGGFVTAVAGIVLTGALALAARRPLRSVSSGPTRRLAAFEAFALLSALTAVLLTFGLTATPCALSPATCELPRGVTFSEAAHEGFFQLLFAGMVLLSLLMALPARTRLDSPRARAAYAALATLLVAATMPMIVSGAARLWRYQEAYGLTTLRLLAWAGLALVAAALAWRAVTMWVAKEAFVHGALALFVATLLTLAVAGPDRVIARHNLAMEDADLRYLGSLSEDVVPALAEALAQVDCGDAVALEQQLAAARARLPAEDALLNWNLGRARARASLARAAQAASARHSELSER